MALGLHQLRSSHGGPVGMARLGVRMGAEGTERGVGGPVAALVTASVRNAGPHDSSTPTDRYRFHARWSCVQVGPSRRGACKSNEDTHAHMGNRRGAASCRRGEPARNTSPAANLT